MSVLSFPYSPIIKVTFQTLTRNFDIVYVHINGSHVSHRLLPSSFLLLSIETAFICSFSSSHFDLCYHILCLSMLHSILYVSFDLSFDTQS